MSLTNEQKKEFLESALFSISLKDPFYAGLMTEMNIQYSDFIPTSIMYIKEQGEYRITLNTHQCSKWNVKERAAVLMHEILHFSHQHILRAPENVMKEQKLWNIAMDMAINQLIQDLPVDCVNVKNFKLTDGNPFPTLGTMELYYELLQQHREANKEELAKYEKPKCSGKHGKPGEKGPNGEELEPCDGSCGGDTQLDSHDWDGTDEETMRKMAEDAKKIVKRTIEKTNTGHSQVPGALKDLLIKLEELTAKLNYKKILKDTIKKTVCVTDRENTWNRPNKRYNSFAPGTRNGRLPNVEMYVDTSGSISHKELNQFLNVISGFLKAGTKKCTLGLWHTDLYYYKPFKLNQQLVESEVEAGGTDITPAMEKIRKNNPDLSIILTDGYFSAYTGKIHSQVIWIISKGGNKEHPMKHLGKTISLESILDG